MLEKVLYVMMAGWVVGQGARDHEPYYANLDDAVDELLPRVSELMRKRGYDKLIMPDVGVDGVPPFIGVSLLGASQLSRAGEANATDIDSMGLTVHADLRIHSPVLTIYYSVFTQSNITWHIDFVDFHVDFRLLTPPKGYPVNCMVDTQSVKILRVGPVVQYSSDPKNNGVPLQKEIVDYVVETNNKIFESEQIISRVNFFGSNFCEVPSPF